MDEKKLEQVQVLEDQQLEGVSGGARDNDALLRGVNEAADDEELDGKIPHLPSVRPIKPGPGGSSDSW